MAHCACARGAARVTVGDVVDRAGVSRRTFYELFEGVESCLLAAAEDALDCAQRYVLHAYDPSATWRERIRAGVSAFICFLEDEPMLGRLLLVESLAGGRTVLDWRGRALAPAVAAVDAARADARGATTLSPLVAEGAVGAVLSVLHTRLVAAGEARPADGSLLALAPVLTSMIVRPYLGAAAARAEFERPAPAPTRPPSSLPLTAEPLGKLPLRLTARTMAVLGAIAQHPGASNRRIGKLAGIEDQGQMSKLLQRLRGYGLIANDSPGPSRGAPNAWTLTPRGADLCAGLTRAPRRRS
jgi:AcrR family transcriptional regulator